MCCQVSPRTIVRASSAGGINAKHVEAFVVVLTQDTPPLSLPPPPSPPLPPLSLAGGVLLRGGLIDSVECVCVCVCVDVVECGNWQMARGQEICRVCVCVCVCV